MASKTSSPSDDALYGSDKDANAYDVSSPTSGAATPAVESPIGETPAEREARMSELSDELEKVEGEINMLRQVLGSKVRHASELKRQLGITPFQEFKNDLSSGLQTIKSSDGYQKTSGALSTAGEKTKSVFSSVGQVMSKKMGDIKNSNTFKSFDERVSTTYASVKAKVTGSRSSTEIDEAFRDAQVSEEGVTIPSHDDSISSLPDGEKVPL